MKEALIIALACLAVTAQAQTQSQPFDGRKWNVSTGNLSVSFIQASPIGALPKEGYQMEAPPSVESLVELKKQGLVAFEDYIAWGSVEREQGKWNWTQHDIVCDTVRKAGLEYVVYNWVHFPPVWLREDAKDERTLMRCVEHKKDTHYLSIFDPKTIEHYDHFYKALSEHFGDKIDGIYACILGPYGEGNYPLLVDWCVNIGHCHEGYWCQDPYALTAFRNAMLKQYGDIDKLNTAWGTDFAGFSAVRPPREIAEGFTPKPEAFKTGFDRRRWIDFISWYHQAIIDFADESIKVVMKYFPREKIRTKPGGNAGGVNPIAWGTYSPGYAKMAGKYGITMQPADCRGAVFGDKWVGTSYKFYGVPLSTEPAGGLDSNTFVKRMFSDASCGASQLFTYDYAKHAADVMKYIHLFTGQLGDTDIAVLCPTTLYRLGGNVWPTINAADGLRDLTEFDVLDELLIEDGILDKNPYRVIIVYQGDYIDQPILDKLEAWVKRGGMLVTASDSIQNVEGETSAPLKAVDSKSGVRNIKIGKGSIVSFTLDKEDKNFFNSFRSALIPFLKTNDAPDGVWTCKRDNGVMMLNTNDKPVKVTFGKHEIEIAPHAIFESK